MRHIPLLLLISFSLLFLSGCDETTSTTKTILKSTTTPISEAAGTWIAVEVIHDSVGTIDTISMTEATGYEIFVITDTTFETYQNNDTATGYLRSRVTATERMEPLFVSPGVSVDQGYVTVNILREVDTMTLVLSQNLLGATKTITVRYERYAGSILPASWPPIEVIDIPTAPVTLTSVETFNTIASFGDEEWFSFPGIAGTHYTITTSGELDSYLRLYEVHGGTLVLIDENDDYGYTFSSQIEWTCPITSTYYVSVRGLADFMTGDFGIKIQ